MERYGDFRVIARHSSHGDAMRVWVEHVRTGERKFVIIPVR